MVLFQNMPLAKSLINTLLKKCINSKVDISLEFLKHLKDHFFVTKANFFDLGQLGLVFLSCGKLFLMPIYQPQQRFHL